MTSFVRGNENVMSCGTTSCGAASSTTLPSISVNNTYIETQKESASVLAVWKFLADGVAQIIDRLRQHELAFESKFLQGGVEANAKLLANVSGAMSAVKQALTGLRDWNAEAKNLVDSLLEQLLRYATTRDIIEQMKGTYVSGSQGLPQDELSRANHYLRTSKSMLAQHKRLTTLGSAIATGTLRLRSLRDGFVQGILHYNNGRSVHLDEAFEAIHNLDGSNVSPLARVQQDLVRLVNSGTLSFNLRAPELIATDVGDAQKQTFETALNARSRELSGGDADAQQRQISEMILHAEAGLAHSVYTESTKREYERVVRAMRDLYEMFKQQHPERDLTALEGLIAEYTRRVRTTRLPQQVLQELRAAATQADDTAGLHRAHSQAVAVTNKLSQHANDRVWFDVFVALRDEIAASLRRAEDAENARMVVTDDEGAL